MNPNPPLSVALYCRVSSDEQAEARTIDNQLQFLRKYCDLHGHRIAAEYLDNGVSATVPLAERPEGRKLLPDAKAKKFGLVLIYRLDRLSRNTLHLLELVDTLDSLGIGLRSATEEFNTQTPTGRLVLTILGSIATLERETILERTWLGRVRAAGQGRVPGGMFPIGYRFEDGAVVIHDEEAIIVRRIFSLYTRDRLGSESIAQRLNAEGIPSAKWLQGKGQNGYKGKASSGQWCAARVLDVLKNPAYRGVYEYGHLSIACPAIIDTVTWDAAQRQREQNTLLSGRNTKWRTYLLKGLIHCASCGRRYVGNGSRTKPAGYTCPNRKPPVKCPGPRVPALFLEEAIWRRVAEHVRTPGPVLNELAKQLKEESARQEPCEGELETVYRSLSALDSEKQRLLTMYRKGRFSDADLDQQFDAIEQERETLVKRREELAGRLMATHSHETQLINAEQMLNALQGQIDNADDMTKAEIIHALVRDVIIHPDRRIEVTYSFAPSGIDYVSWGTNVTNFTESLRMLTTGEYAAQIGRSPDTVTWWVSRGRLDVIKQGKWGQARMIEVCPPSE